MSETEKQVAVKSMAITDVKAAKDNISDLQIFGMGDLWKLLSKASSEKEGWMKSTKAMQVAQGCLVQVTTQQRNPDGSYVVAEAVTYVPGVKVAFVGNDASLGRVLKPL